MTKICLGQILLEGGEPERNLQRIQDSVKNAHNNNCDIILLPECSDLSWTHPSSYSKASEIPGKYSEVISNLAREYNIDICCGLTEKAEDKIYNSAIYVDNKGNLIEKYRKINVLSKGGIYSIGNKLSVFQTRLGKVGINICSDNYANSICLAESICKMGADIILSPSSWTVNYSEDRDDPYGLKWKAPINYVSKKYSIVFATVTSVGYLVGGPFEGRKMVGCSFLSQNGDIIVQGENNELAGENIIADFTINDNRILGTDLSEKVQDIKLDLDFNSVIEKDLQK